MFGVLAVTVDGCHIMFCLGLAIFSGELELLALHASWCTAMSLSPYAASWSAAF